MCSTPYRHLLRTVDSFNTGLDERLSIFSSFRPWETDGSSDMELGKYGRCFYVCPQAHKCVSSSKAFLLSARRVTARTTRSLDKAKASIGRAGRTLLQPSSRSDRRWPVMQPLTMCSSPWATPDETTQHQLSHFIRSHNSRPAGPAAAH